MVDYDFQKQEMLEMYKNAWTFNIDFKPILKIINS
jgi:hypothetical protein